MCGMEGANLERSCPVGGLKISLCFYVTLRVTIREIWTPLMLHACSECSRRLPAGKNRHENALPCSKIQSPEPPH